MPTPPEKMDPLSTPEEIQKASREPKYNKAIADISNVIDKASVTGSFPEDNRQGTLTPLAKQPKKSEKVM